MADSDDLASILPSGDEKQMLKALESEFKQAKKSDSLERLRQLLPAAEQLEAGRQHARAASRIRYAITQNIARLERAQGGEELVRSVVSADDVAETEPVLRAAADGFTARGRNGQLTVYPTKIVISREGAMGFISQGHKGRKEIDLTQISAVQFKDPGPLTVGYIQFSFIGGSETKHGIRDAVSDENSILFAQKAESAFREAKRLIDQYREELRAPHHAAPAAPDPVEQLERLAGLLERGLLTKDEFELKKRELLRLG
jgi:hypothetical protein